MHLPLPVAAPPVKIAFGAARRPRQTRNKNNLSAEYAQSAAERILNRPTSRGNPLSQALSGLPAPPKGGALFVLTGRWQKPPPFGGGGIAVGDDGEGLSPRTKPGSLRAVRFCVCVGWRSLPRSHPVKDISCHFRQFRAKALYFCRRAWYTTGAEPCSAKRHPQYFLQHRKPSGNRNPGGFLFFMGAPGTPGRFSAFAGRFVTKIVQNA